MRRVSHPVADTYRYVGLRLVNRSERITGKSADTMESTQPTRAGKWADPPEIPLLPEGESSYPETLRFAPKAGAFLAEPRKGFFLADPGFLCGQLQSHLQLATPCPAAISFADNYAQLGDNHRSWKHKK